MYRCTFDDHHVTRFVMPAVVRKVVRRQNRKGRRGRQHARQFRRRPPADRDLPVRHHPPRTAEVRRRWQRAWIPARSVCAVGVARLPADCDHDRQLVGNRRRTAAGVTQPSHVFDVRQWIVGAVGGEPDVRERDREFAARGGVAPAELKERLRSTVDRALAVIRSLPHSRLADRVTIQGYNVTVLEAIYAVVDHFSGHTGQIIFATKFLTGEDLGFYRHLSQARAHTEKTP